MKKLYFLFLFVLIYPIWSFAGIRWTTNGETICAEKREQWYCVLTSDGQRGAIIAWIDDRDTKSSSQIYCQKIDANGNTKWTQSGILPFPSRKGWEPRIVEDEYGGAIITSFWGYTYAQRIDKEGFRRWSENGIIVSFFCYPYVITRDCQGGVIIAGKGILERIYAQRISNNGAFVWNTQGNTVCALTDSKWNISIISDERNGAIVSWADNRNGNWDIYAQRIDENGINRWTPNGITVCNEPTDQQKFISCPDGQGGAIITWADTRSGDWEIYAQRIDMDGNIKWTPNGKRICSAPSANSSLTAVNDGLGGAIISSLIVGFVKIDNNGDTVWITGGVGSEAIVSDGRGGVIEFYKSGSDIYAWHLDKNGIPMWNWNMLEVCSASNDRDSLIAISDGQNGAIVSWRDSRNFTETEYDIYAQRISPPDEVSGLNVIDNPSDTGGIINISWQKNQCDLSLVGYKVYYGNVPFSNVDSAAFINTSCASDSNSNFVSISGLSSETTPYYFAIIATDNLGESHPEVTCVGPRYAVNNKVDSLGKTAVIRCGFDTLTKVIIPPNVAHNSYMNIVSQDETKTVIVTNANAKLNGIDPASITSLECTLRQFSCDTDPLGGTITLVLSYPSNISLYDENKLRLFYLNEITHEWEMVLNTQIDRDANTATLTVDHFSIYRFFVLAYAASNLSQVRAYPNPFKPLQHGTVKLKGLTTQSTIRIYNIAGELVKTKEVYNVDGESDWDGKNDSGEPVASGVYIYFVVNSQNPADKAIGKIMVIR